MWALGLVVDFPLQTNNRRTVSERTCKISKSMNDNLRFCARDFGTSFDIYLQDTRETENEI